MTNRRIFFGIIAIVVALVSVIVGNSFFSVRQVIASNAVATTNNARVSELNQSIVGVQALRTGQSMFTLDSGHVASMLEREFFDIKVISVDKSYPSVVYVEYQLLHKQLEIHNGSKFFQLSMSGRVLGVTTSSVASDDFNQPLVKLNYSRVATSTAIGDFVNDDNFEFVSKFVQRFFVVGPQGFLISSISEIDLNNMNDTSDSKFVIKLKDGSFEIYKDNDIPTAVQLVRENIEDALIGKTVSIRDGQATIT
ncbi:MAG: hypothetical protein LBK70_03430 [Clostridiales bacterium]|jgi:hypothetical protein|nr:hypothetical protein [Clostridiales bacterium]